VGRAGVSFLRLSIGAADIEPALGALPSDLARPPREPEELDPGSTCSPRPSPTAREAFRPGGGRLSRPLYAEDFSETFPLALCRAEGSYATLACCSPRRPPRSRRRPRPSSVHTRPSHLHARFSSVRSAYLNAADFEAAFRSASDLKQAAGALLAYRATSAQPSTRPAWIDVRATCGGLRRLRDDATAGADVARNDEPALIPRHGITEFLSFPRLEVGAVQLPPMPLVIGLDAADDGAASDPALVGTVRVH